MEAKRILAGLVLSLGVMALYAQQDKQSFDNYRASMLKRYETHRTSVLDGYSEYLKGVWKAYQSFVGEKSSEAPKPVFQPVSDSVRKPVSPITWHSDVLPVADIAPVDEMIAPLKSSLKDSGVQKSQYVFYDLKIELPNLEKHEEITSYTPKDIASYWNVLQEKQIGFKWMSGLKSVVAAYGFNDWLEVDLVRHCVNQAFSGSTVETRMVLTHFLLTHLGYDVRLGVTNIKQLVLLIPFHQMVYGRTFIRLDDKKYYVYYDELLGKEEAIPIVSTCEIPETIARGKEVDLIFKRPVVLPENDWKTFHITDGRLSIEGAVSATLMKMLSHYPQMSVPSYAMSILQPELRAQIVKQIKSQINGLNELEAVNAILRFVQYGFQYATDGQQFGYEKPFFVEELLYYPQCDCEDRSVFYAYLVRFVLGMDCHLVKFPGHECTAVKLSQPIDGSGYIYEGVHYFISDPTYVGASAGMCMPDYLQEQPIVECW